MAIPDQGFASNGLLLHSVGLRIHLLTFIFNDAAGIGDHEDAKSILAQRLSEQGFDVRFLAADGEANLREEALRALKNSQAVVACGGDGTVSAVASALVETNIPLGVVPLGTLNHFAKDLGIPTEPRKAAEILIGGRIVEVDVGEVNGHVFLNNVNLGFYSSLVREREQGGPPARPKVLATLLAAAKVFRRYPLLTMRIETAETSTTRSTPFIFVGNNPYEMGASGLGSRTVLDSGELCVYVGRQTGRSGLLRLIVHALSGRNLAQDADRLTVTELWVDSHHRPLQIALDGELRIMDPPLHFHMRRRALRVIAPARVAEAA